MKTTLLTLLAGTALLSLVGIAQAGSDITSNDGIAASPKYRQMLTAQKPAAPAATLTQKMACGTCKDQVTTRTDINARGANKPVVTTTTHLCGNCETHLKVTGHGKDAKAVANHTCTAGKTASCCSTGS